MSERSPRLLLKRDIRAATTEALKTRRARLSVQLEHSHEFVRTPGRRALVAELRDINDELMERITRSHEARS